PFYPQPILLLIAVDDITVPATVFPPRAHSKLTFRPCSGDKSARPRFSVRHRDARRYDHRGERGKAKPVPPPSPTIPPCLEALHGLSGPQALNNRRASILPQRRPGVGHGIRQEAPELSQGFHPSQPQGGYDKGSVVRLLAGRTNFHCRGVSPRPGRVPRVVLVPEVGVDIGTVLVEVFCKRPVVLAEATAAPENVAGMVADMRDELLH